MDTTNQVAIFIVGIGAPDDLYTDFLNNLKKRLPQTKFLILEWWKQSDYGMSTLQSLINNSNVILIAHSAGGVIALQALAKWPDNIKKIVMLDSHFLRSHGSFPPTINTMLDTMLSKDTLSISNRVKKAYAPIIVNDVTFNNALNFAFDWVRDHFNNACTRLNSMPAHSALYIGFSNPSYQKLRAEDEKSLLALWEKSGVDVSFHPMNHFDLIDMMYATAINQSIADWLRL